MNGHETAAFFGLALFFYGMGYFFGSLTVPTGLMKVNSKFGYGKVKLDDKYPQFVLDKEEEE